MSQLSSDDERSIASVCVCLATPEAAANVVLERGIGPISGNAILAENNGGDIAVAGSGGMAIERNERVPKPERPSAPSSRRVQKFGRPRQNLP